MSATCAAKPRGICGISTGLVWKSGGRPRSWERSNKKRDELLPSITSSTNSTDDHEIDCMSGPPARVVAAWNTLRPGNDSARTGGDHRFAHVRRPQHSSSDGGEGLFAKTTSP